MRKYVYCQNCWCKLDNEKCGCNMSKFFPESEYFCGNCNTHVKVNPSKEMKQIITLMKKLKIPFPTEEIADYSL